MSVDWLLSLSLCLRRVQQMRSHHPGATASTTDGTLATSARTVIILPSQAGKPAAGPLIVPTEAASTTATIGNVVAAAAVTLKWTNAPMNDAQISWSNLLLRNADG